MAILQPPEFQPFVKRKYEFNVQDNCLLWGGRVVVPRKLRDKVLHELHVTHPGISQMKSLTHQYIWWPGLDLDIENRVKSCNACQAVHHKSQVATSFQL